MTFARYDIVGTFGVSIIVLTYVLLQVGKIRSEQLAYSLLNGVGAALILISLWFAPNLPSIVVEGFWLLISIYGVGRYLRRKHER